MKTFALSRISRSPHLAGLGLLMAISGAVASHAADYSNAKCSPDAAIRQKIEAWDVMRQGMHLTEDWFLAGIEQSNRLALQDPEDIYLQRERDTWIYQDPTLRPALIREREARYRENPENAAQAYLLARLLAVERSPRTIQILEATLGRHPRFAQAHLLLAHAYRSRHGTPGSAAEIEQISAYRKLCPDAAEGFSAMRRLPRSEWLTREVQALKKRLDASLSPGELEHVRAYWGIAFAAWPPEGHQAIRQDLARWLSTLRQRQGPWGLGELQTLVEGFTLAQETEGRTWAENAILEKFSRSGAARNLLEDRWQEHRQAASTKAAPSDAELARAARLRHLNDLLKLAPFSPELINSKFRLLSSDQNTSDAEILATGAALRKVLLAPPRPHYFAKPAPLLIAAEVYVSRGIGLDQVPELVGESLQAISHHRATTASWLGGDEAGRARILLELDAQEILALGLMVEVASQTGDLAQAARQLALAKGILAKHSAIDPGDSRYGVHLSSLARYQRAVSALELAAGNKRQALDALRVAESWDRQSGQSYYRTARDVVRERISVLETELGNRAPPASEPQARERSRHLDWQDDSAPFPVLTLVDVSGRSWHSKDWRGKTVFLNYWATWCGPCRAELPLIQVLSEKYADRKDLLFVTVNMDEEVSSVLPFVAGLRLRLPVLLGWPQRESLLGAKTGAVPVTLIVDKEGIVRKRQIGFVQSEVWLAETEALLASFSLKIGPESPESVGH